MSKNNLTIVNKSIKKLKIPQDFESYFVSVGSLALLTREEELELAKAYDAARWKDENGLVSFENLWRNDVPSSVLTKAKIARNKMVNHNLRLVIQIAKKYMNRGCEFEDLIQEGNLGLIRGIDGYDFRKTHVEINGQTMNNKLSTYCTSWIHQKISRLVQNHSRTVRVPVHIQNLSIKINKMIDEYTIKNGESPTLSYLLEEINKEEDSSKRTKKSVQQATDCKFSKTVSLDEPHSANGESGQDNTLYNAIISESPLQDDLIFREEMSELIRATLKELTPREEKIARLRFGIIESSDNLEEFSLTPEQIHEFEKYIIESETVNDQKKIG